MLTSYQLQQHYKTVFAWLYLNVYVTLCAEENLVFFFFFFCQKIHEVLAVNPTIQMIKIILMHVKKGTGTTRP